MKCRIERIAALLLAMMLLLTGCGDPVKEIEKETAGFEKKYAQVAATYDGGDITIGEAMPDFSYLYNMYYNYMMMYGLQITGAEIEAMMLDNLKEHVRREVAAAHFDAEYGLTEEEIAAVQAQADEQYAGIHAEAMKEAQGESDAEKAAHAELLLVRSGLNEERIHAALLLEKKVARMEEILGEEVSEPTEEELMAAYEEMVTEDETAYTSGSAYLEMDMIDAADGVCWIPEGYRTVKHILLIPDTEVMTAYGTALNALSEGEAALEALQEEKKAAEDDDSEEGPARSVEELEGLIAAAEEETVKLEEAVKAAEQACRDAVRETTDVIYARLAAGESFDDLMAEFGQDPGMKQEPTMSSGYYVAASSQIWEPNFRNGAISLENVGDYSAEPVISGSGVHIICYTGDVPAGPVPFEQLRTGIYDQVLETSRSAHAQEIIAAWVEEAKPTYDVEKFVKAFED